MPKDFSYLKLLQYAPSVVGVIKQLRSAPTAEAVIEDVEKNRQALDDLKRNLSQRLDDLEQENTRLKTRIRELESSATILRVLVYTGGGVGIIALVLSLITIIRLAS